MLLHLLSQQVAVRSPRSASLVPVHGARSIASSKSTKWPSNSGPSTQANLVSPPTGQTAAAAHTGAVDHNGVHRSQRFGCRTSRSVCAHKLHHHQRADGDHLVVFARRFESASPGRWSPAPFHRTEPSSVISTYRSQTALNSSSKITRSLVRKPTMRVHLGAAARAAPWPPGTRWRSPRRRRPQPPCGQPVTFGGMAQRAHKVLQAVAHLQPCQLLGGRAHQLEDNGHRTGCRGYSPPPSGGSARPDRPPAGSQTDRPGLSLPHKAPEFPYAQQSGSAPAWQRFYT